MIKYVALLTALMMVFVVACTVRSNSIGGSKSSSSPSSDTTQTKDEEVSESVRFILNSLDNQGVLNMASDPDEFIPPLGTVEGCLKKSADSYPLLTDGYLHIFAFNTEEEVKLVVEKFPKPANCGPWDWVYDVYYYSYANVIVLLATQDSNIMSILDDLLGQPFSCAVGGPLGSMQCEEQY